MFQSRVPVQSACMRCWSLALWSSRAPRTRERANMGAQSISRKRLLGIWCSKEHRRCAVARVSVARSPPTGASFPAALGGIQCSIGRTYCTLGAKHMYVNRFATKVCVEKRIFWHARRVSCAMGELLEKEVVFCKVPRKSGTTKSLITLEPIGRFCCPFGL